MHGFLLQTEVINLPHLDYNTSKQQTKKKVTDIRLCRKVTLQSYIKGWSESESKQRKYQGSSQK